jgi:hypothetical protein
MVVLITMLQLLVAGQPQWVEWNILLGAWCAPVFVACLTSMLSFMMPFSIPAYYFPIIAARVKRKDAFRISGTDEL